MINQKLISVGTPFFLIFGLGPIAHATSLDDVCNTTITGNTIVDESGEFTGECRIKVVDARLEILGITIAINNSAPDEDDGELRIDDDSEDGGVAELVIKNASITTGDRLRVEGAWDGGVTFKNNHVDTGDDLRIKPIGSGDLVFKNNRGEIVDDIRLGDVIKVGDDDDEQIVGGLEGDMDVRNNRLVLVRTTEEPSDPAELVVQSYDGDIDLRNNRFGDVIERVDITASGGGDVAVRNSEFSNDETAQEVTIRAVDGDVSVLNNGFGVTVDPVDIKSAGGECQSARNTPDLVDQLACPF